MDDGIVIAHNAPQGEKYCMLNMGLSDFIVEVSK